MVRTVDVSKRLTEGQIDEIQRLLSAGLRGANIDSVRFRQVLRHYDQQIVEEFIATVRRKVEDVDGFVIRLADVDFHRTPVEALKATRRILFADPKVLHDMPKGHGGQTEVILFKPDRGENSVYFSDKDLEKAYKLRFLVPTDPFSLSAVNEHDPAFADTKPNRTRWKDCYGRWCFVAFNRWRGDRVVSVGLDNDNWGDDWWFAGVRASA